MRTASAREAAPARESEPVAGFEMDCARHSIKGEKPREALTRAGMDAAVKAGLENTEAVRETLGQVYGSPRERTGQSSVLRMFAERFKEVDFSDVDPEDVVRWLQEGGLKKTETPFLNFQLGEGDYNAEFMKEFKAGNLLRWLVDRSDEKAVETKQKPDKVTTFSIQAGNVASFFFAKIWEAYTGETRGAPLPKDFATSHQSVLECFLFKVIERHDGREAAERFVASLKNKGFDENQGFTLKGNVYDRDDAHQWDIDLTYQGKTYKIAPDELFQIMKEGEDLKDRLAEQREA